MANMLEGKGVQMMFANIIKAAAPGLVEQVTAFGQMLLDFKQQLDRIEAQQKLLLQQQTPVLTPTTEEIANERSGRLGRVDGAG